MNKRRFRPATIKILASAGLVGAAATVAGLGTFGTFTSTTSASQSVSAGTVSIGLGSAGTAANRLTVGAANLLPGDTIERQVQLTNNGNQALAGISLTTTASPSSALDTDVTNGLQLTVQSCPTAWTEAGTAPAYTYTCSGTATAVVASRPVIAANAPLTGLNALHAGGSDNLLVTLTFPSSAGNTFQGLSDAINFSFTGVQRTAQAA